MKATQEGGLKGFMAAKGWRILKAGRVSAIREGFHWHVSSESSNRVYAVHRGDESWNCTCPAFSTALPCKHVAACQLLVHATPIEPATRPPKKNYAQNWAAYDLGQTKELPVVQQLLDDLASSIAEPSRLPSESGRPPVPLHDQFFAAVLKVWAGKSGRRATGFWANAARDGYLEGKVGRMTVQRFLNREDMTPVLSNLVTMSALPLAGLEEGGVVAPDSTGIQTTSFGAWRETKHGEQRDRHWLKTHAMVGTRTHVIIRAVVGEEDSGDSPQFAPLLRWTVEAGFHPDRIVADKGYLSKENYRLASELGLEAYIPFKSNSVARNPTKTSPSIWRKAFHLFQANREEFDRNYHRRSNVESVFSALKQKFGENVRSRTHVAQVNEVLCKIIAYNLSVVVHEMFEHGIVPAFVGAR
jgi:transposase